MKKFRFPLRSVATVRAMRELRAREIFSAAVQAYAGAEEALAAIRRRISDLEDVLRGARTRVFRAADQVSLLQTHRREAAGEAAAVKFMEKTKAEMERCRQAWLESRRDLRLLENLELKARVTHRLVGEREEQAMLDDRTNALFARAD